MYERALKILITVLIVACVLCLLSTDPPATGGLEKSYELNREIASAAASITASVGRQNSLLSEHSDLVEELKGSAGAIRDANNASNEAGGQADNRIGTAIAQVDQLSGSAAGASNDVGGIQGGLEEVAELLEDSLKGVRELGREIDHLTELVRKAEGGAERNENPASEYYGPFTTTED